MTVISIVSANNPKYKLLKGISTQSSVRKDARLFMVEGREFVRQTLDARPESVVALVTTDPVNTPVSVDQWVLTPSLFKSISRLAHANESVIAILRRPDGVIPELTRFAVVLDHLQTPSNIGAIVRNAVAFGADFVWISDGSADPFHPESIRAMAGNWYQVPIVVAPLEQAVSQFGTAQWILLDSHVSEVLNQRVVEGTVLVVIGSEGKGIVSPCLVRMPKSARFRIDMEPGVESLNAAVTSGIVLHHLMGHHRKD